MTIREKCLLEIVIAQAACAARELAEMPNMPNTNALGRYRQRQCDEAYRIVCSTPAVNVEAA